MAQGTERYLPIEASDSSVWCRPPIRTTSAPGVDGVQLASAQYRASLVGDDILTGEALLTITGQPASPVLLPLEPLGLAISKAAWDGDVSGAAAARASAPTAASVFWSSGPAR